MKKLPVICRTIGHGYGTRCANEETELCDIQNTFDFIPDGIEHTHFDTPSLKRLRKLLKEKRPGRCARYLVTYCSFKSREDEYKNPDSAEIKRTLEYNLHDAAVGIEKWDKALHDELMSIKDGLREERWDHEDIDRKLTMWRFDDWKLKYAWDLTPEEVAELDHPFKGMI